MMAGCISQLNKQEGQITYHSHSNSKQLKLQKTVARWMQKMLTLAEKRDVISFIDAFRWVSPLHYLKNGWQNAVLLWCMLQAGPPSLHYYCTVTLHSCIILPPVGHSSNLEYHCCQLTRQLSCVSNFYRTFKLFIWLSLVYLHSPTHPSKACQRKTPSLWTLIVCH